MFCFVVFFFLLSGKKKGMVAKNKDRKTGKVFRKKWRMS